MADTPIDYTNLASTIGSAGISALGNVAANSAIQKGVQQGQQYIAGAYDTAAGLMKPYSVLGTENIAGTQQAANSLNQPYTMDQFNQSAYGQLADRTIKDQTDAMQAKYAQGGNYGSGNMANAVAQNALTTKLGAYDTASQRDLGQKQAGYNALYGLMNTGFTGAQQLGGYATDAGKNFSNLAGVAATANSQTASQLAGTAGTAFKSAIAALSPAAQAAWGKVTSGQSGTLSPEEKALIDSSKADVQASVDARALFEADMAGPTEDSVQTSAYWNNSQYGNPYGDMTDAQIAEMYGMNTDTSYPPGTSDYNNAYLY